MPPNQPGQDYSFIMNPAPPPRRGIADMLPTGSLVGRIIFIVGGLITLLIVFSIAKSLLFHGPDFSSFVGIAQDQQRMLNILKTSDSQQATLSSTNKNFAANAEASLTSQQSALESYLHENHYKLKTKQLNLKVSASLDAQLQTAVSDGTYDSTFHSTMQQELSTYQQHLKQTYLQASGSKGRQILKNEYTTAQLLLQQLNSPAS